MSIQTRIKPEKTKLRDKKTSTLTDTSYVPGAQSGESEVEISIPALLLIIFGLGAVIFGGIYLFKNGQNGGSVEGTKPVPQTLAEGLVPVEVSLDNVSIQGDNDSDYIFIEYSDFECPYCKMFATGLDFNTGLMNKAQSSYNNILINYVDTGKIKYGYTPYIGVASHKPAATNEVIAYYCAEAQGKEVEFAERVFELSQTNGLGIDGKGALADSINSVAADVGLNASEFDKCYQERDIVSADKIQQKVDNEVRGPWTSVFGSNNFGTPFFVICKVSSEDPGKCKGNAFVGAWPYGDISVEIDNFITADADTSTVDNN